MRRKRSLAPALVLSLLIAAPANCAEIVGLVFGANGDPLNGANVGAVNSAGQQVGQGRSDIYGRYCISGLSPGAYTLNLTPPPATGYIAGSAPESLGAEGLTVDWSTCPQAPAAATSTPGVTSLASATCGGFPLWTLAAAGLGIVPLGVLGGLYFPGGGGGGGGPPPATSKK